ncbi:BNR-4 repeat-containing protein [Tautonia plasticadhaerens]|uniref:BNR/Asp-box repeat protein n=1 Tax=Tautonia plasticadhaerens TaxID=2527974 RepID=A0A518H2P5_9BACT|nr:BNR-4 repeat-containing protein [Tautonia plasticadhaerens]QDV35104.1 hypothetical protein ElP_30060 [Tautonia plasticadhaerens]
MTATSRIVPLAALIAATLAAPTARGDGPGPQPKAEGYRGIWYFNQPSGDEYKYKYSGGFATYPQQHIPIAIYSEEADITFFVFGGRPEGEDTLLMMIGAYDHATGTVPRPTILLDKQTTDAHDNPVLSIDDEGHLWVFSNAHGTGRPAFIHRSVRPFDIDEFEQVEQTNFSYGQPWHLGDDGFLFLHTRYRGGRRVLHWMASDDGRSWSEPRPLASMELGHYQISAPHGGTVGTAFNMHPEPVGLNARTNLYYVQTADAGRSWTTVEGTPVEPPMTDPAGPGLVHDYRGEGMLVYLKDLRYDAEGRPVILYLTSEGYESGPDNGPRTWRTAHWTGSAWRIRPVTTSDHNYDFGSLYVEPDGTWRLIAPTDPGPQPFGTGGEVVMWTSGDEGESWDRVKALTPESEYNHTYVRRPVDAHPGFYALWADGHARQPSPSRLYFTDREGSRVWRLPGRIDGDRARPEVVRWGEGG